MAKLLALVAGARAAHHHLNPTMPYTITNEAPGHEGESREFSGAAYFDVDSPVLTMRYSEVAWRTLPAVPLPAEVVAKYANATIAVTGFEVDVLRDLGNGATESVAAYDSYNHHYGVLDVEVAEGAAPPGARLAQSFVHGNGQEHRQMFHGAPPAAAALEPVDVRRRAHADLDERRRRRPGPGPAAGHQAARRRDARAAVYAYSPLLECPCTTRNEINATAGTVDGHAFDGDCDRAEPLSDLNATKNPTCEAATYVGGLSCCADGAFLLDADQEPPAFEDRVFFRFRFYYDDWDDDKYADIEHVEWAANGCDSGCSGGGCANACGHIEFDVVRGVGSDEGDDVQIFQSTFPAGEMLASSCKPTDCQCMGADTVGESGFALVMAASHCHAPNCIRQVLKNLDSGEILCDGKTRVGSSEKVFDEAGYLFTPPCLWGAAADGLLAPPVLKKDTTLQMLTYFNSTYAHPGQMGIWQMKATALSA
ncbi:hypothetical protein JL721_7511 [Aureococcus anophagefferens]|nr:hypothetical protein JL721_7511 [Aureococcus anophagefferens]